MFHKPTTLKAIADLLHATGKLTTLPDEAVRALFWHPAEPHENALRRFDAIRHAIADDLAIHRQSMACGQADASVA